MGLLALFRRTPPTASVAKERLRIIVAQERGARGGPDYLPLLRRELLEVVAMSAAAVFTSERHVARLDTDFRSMRRITCPAVGLADIATPCAEAHRRTFG